MVRYALLRKATHHERLLTRRVNTPFALSSPRSERIEELAVRQPRFLGLTEVKLYAVAGGPITALKICSASWAAACSTRS